MRREHSSSLPSLFSRLRHERASGTAPIIEVVLLSGGPVTSRSRCGDDAQVLPHNRWRKIFFLIRNLHHLHVSIWKARATHARRYEVAYCVTSSSFETSDGTVDWEQTSKSGKHPRIRGGLEKCQRMIGAVSSLVGGGVPSKLCYS